MLTKRHALVVGLLAWLFIDHGLAADQAPLPIPSVAAQGAEGRAVQADDAKLVPKTPPAPPAQLWSLVWVLAVFGGFGGVLAALAECPLKDLRQKGIEAFGNARRLWSCLLIGALWGIGGAISLAALAALDGKFDSFKESDQILFAFLSVASGFVGLQMLTLMGRRLTKEVEAAVDEKTREAKVEMKKESEIVQELTEAMGSAVGALGQPLGTAAAYRKEALKKLLNVRNKLPTNRTVNIYIGRIYRSIDELDNAIGSLSEALGARTKAKIIPNDDDSALLFNRACYYNLNAEKADTAGQGAEAELFRQKAWEDLKESCRLTPNNKAEAASDPDLRSLFKPKVRDLGSL